jgi:hypothetical protein
MYLVDTNLVSDFILNENNAIDSISVIRSVDSMKSKLVARSARGFSIRGTFVPHDSDHSLTVAIHASASVITTMIVFITRRVG